MRMLLKSTQCQPKHLIDGDHHSDDFLFFFSLGIVSCLYLVVTYAFIYICI